MVSAHTPAPTERERLLAVVGASAEIVAAALLVRAEGAFFQEHGLAAGLLIYGPAQFTRLNPGEARFFLAQLIAGVPAALLLADAAGRLLGARTTAWSRRLIADPRLVGVLFAVCAAAALQILTSAVLLGSPMTDDENVYIFQARQLLAGHFSSPFPHYPFLFEFVLRASPENWAGAYPPGQPLLIALGLLLKAPHLTQIVCAAAIVYVAARFADEIWGVETSVLTGALLATSPLLLFTAASLHNAVPATLCVLIAVRATWHAVRRGWRRDHVLAGLALSGALLCRPYDAILIGAPVGFFLLRAAYRRSATGNPFTAEIAVAVLGALPLALFFLVANHAVTGSALKPAYTAWMEQRFPDATTIGFGQTVFATDARGHTPQVMFSKEIVVLSRLSTWLFGWPFSYWPFMLVLLGIGRDRPARFLLAFIGVHFAGYCLYTLNAVHDFGSPYHLAEAPLLAMLSARGLVAASEQLRVFGDRLRLWPYRLALACGLLALLTFWPAEVSWLSQTAQNATAPIIAAQAAAGNSPAIVFWRRMQPTSHNASWVFRPPLPGPAFDDQILWVFEDTTQDLAAVIAAYPDRKALRLEWGNDDVPRVVPYEIRNAPAKE